MRIIIDTREQHPLIFRKSSVIEGTNIKKLDVGDYSIAGYENKIAIERKSANDLFQTLGKGHKRFQKELERSKNYDYFAIVVEIPFLKVLSKEFPNSHYIFMRGDVIAQICCTIEVKYGIKFWFCNGRNEVTAVVRNLLKAYWKQQEVKK